MIRTVVFLFYLLLTASVEVYAQERKIENLSQIHIGAGYMPVLHFSPETFDYKPLSMLRFTLGANYLGGYIRTNFQYTSLEVYNGQPGCEMFDNSMSYLYYFRLPKGFSVYAGGQAGLNTIYFPQNDLYPDRSFETEVSAGLEAGAEWLIGTRLGISCSYKLQRIFATPRNNLSALDIGIVYYFKPNNKIKQWLE